VGSVDQGFFELCLNDHVTVLTLTGSRRKVYLVCTAQLLQSSTYTRRSYPFTRSK
jgi:hypothetical protein